MMFLPLKRYAEFSGRSRRMEYWLWALFNLIVTGVLCYFIFTTMFHALADLAQRAQAGEFANYSGDASSVTLNGEKYAVPPEAMAQAISSIFGLPFIILMIWSLAIFVPNLAVIVRRLHDQNKSGWWFFISFVPFIGGIWFLVLMLIDGTPGPNQYGPDPKGRGGSDPRTFA